MYRKMTINEMIDTAISYTSFLSMGASIGFLGYTIYRTTYGQRHDFIKCMDKYEETKDKEDLRLLAISSRLCPSFLIPEKRKKRLDEIIKEDFFPRLVFPEIKEKFGVDDEVIEDVFPSMLGFEYPHQGESFSSTLTEYLSAHPSRLLKEYKKS